MESCPFCPVSVEAVLVEADGSLHTCAPIYQERAQRRRLVDEVWWQRMEASAQTPEQPVDVATLRQRFAGEI